MSQCSTATEKRDYPSTSHLYGIAEILSADDGSVSHPSDGRVSIGGPDRNDNYAYAVVKGGVVSCSSEIAPPTASLTALLDNTAKEPVKDVVLGHGGSWFLQYTDGTYKFDLAGRYQELSQILQSGVTNIQVGACRLAAVYAKFLQMERLLRAHC